MRIKETVEILCRQCDTRNPFQLATDLGAILLFEDLGQTHGYYSHCYEDKFIHINSRLSEQQQIMTCAHELGHFVLHPGVNTPHLKANTFFSVSKFELEANRFMVQLLIPDGDMRGFFEDGLGIYQIADMYGLPAQLIEYKVKTMGFDNSNGLYLPT